MPCKILYESFQDGNWDLFLANADGSHAVNLTHTPDVDKLYPHANNDGTKICFLADEGKGHNKVRNLYVMNIDGSGRKLLAKNARDPCWNADGTAIAYLKGEFEEFTFCDYASKGIYVYDLKTGKHWEHPNKSIEHLYNLCWTPDGKWFVATVHAGMGFGHAILAVEAHGMKVVNLKIPGCRPDLSFADGRRIAWGCSDSACGWRTSTPAGGAASTQRPDRRGKRRADRVYHIDWSPNGKYVAFSRGPASHRLGFACGMIGVPRRWLEYLRGRRHGDQPLRRHHPRRQVAQGARLGAGKETRAMIAREYLIFVERNSFRCDTRAAWPVLAAAPLVGCRLWAAAQRRAAGPAGVGLGSTGARGCSGAIHGPLRRRSSPRPRGASWCGFPPAAFAWGAPPASPTSRRRTRSGSTRC